MCLVLVSGIFFNGFLLWFIIKFQLSTIVFFTFSPLLSSKKIKYYCRKYLEKLLNKQVLIFEKFQIKIKVIKANINIGKKLDIEHTHII